MNLLQKFEENELATLSAGKEICEFKAGDTIRVHVKIVEGTNQRVQLFEGVCIGRKHRGMHSSFRMYKVSHGEGVERLFPLYSPNIDKIELVKKGVVRRAKLYYMRDRRGKSARIKEDLGLAARAAMKASRQAKAPVAEAESNEAAE